MSDVDPARATAGYDPATGTLSVRVGPVVRTMVVPASGTTGGGATAGAPAAAPAGWSHYASAVLASEPEQYWRMEETSGTTAASATDPNHTGAYVGRARTLSAEAGLDGLGLREGGVDLGLSAAIGPVADYAVELWIRGTKAPSYASVITGIASGDPGATRP